jgi:two-component system response regulator FixJ
MNYDQNIFIVDDDETLRGSLRWLLESLKLNVHTYASAREFLLSYDPAQPGCLLLDVRMPEISGLQLQDILKERGIRIPIIIITGHADVSMAVRAMKAGALDFIEKPFNDQDLLENVQQALEIDTRQRREEDQQRIASEHLASLTSREREVLEKVLYGKPNKRIAAELGISTKTVEAHRSKVMEKIGVNSPLELASVYFTGTGYKGKPLTESGTSRMFKAGYPAYEHGSSVKAVGERWPR